MNHRRLFRACLLAAGLVGTSLLAGCWDRTEVNDLALITGAAIDRYDDKQIQLSVQIFIPRASSGGGGSGGMEMGAKGGVGSSNTFVISAIGENIADALSHLQEKMPRKLFWGHAEVIIFGEAEARKGIRDDVDYLMRAPQPRERAYIYVSQGKAKNSLDIPSVLERDSSEALREIAKSKASMSVTMTELSKMLTGDSGAAALPWIKKNAPNSKKNPDKVVSYANGTAIFRGDRMIGVVDETTTRGILWLRNEIKYAVVTVNPEGAKGNVSMKLLRSKTKLIPHIKDGKWSMTVRIRTESDALQNTTSQNLMSGTLAAKRVQKAMNADMLARVSLALLKVQRELKADVFDFAGEFHRAYPKTWHRAQNRWDELFPEVEVTVLPDSRLLRPGLSDVKATKQSGENER
ncbi:Ger(x)C family spore germination protein [Paenibacillus rhizovicinus]|uniref:Ger(X)C family spore germination protein n=1 Tax=Paenibacillus rhizovicinus TaxID=2704463 RepID=A0A6C0P408_9BACL|nr:Ger(x)C family spore germination protein [Paenibacillus rhizovicinus]QHW33197.1 Ger(x)C family spore germination protein [Paenibacillus rhizovicinus]